MAGIILVRKLLRPMNIFFKEPDESGAVKRTQILNNIELIMSEIRLLNNHAISSRISPVYRTMQEFEIQEFFDLFGLKETPFLRLSKSKYLNMLPSLIIVHCSNFPNDSDDEPKLIDDRLFISHEYFQAWVTSKNNERFENELLQLTLMYLNTTSNYSN